MTDTVRIRFPALRNMLSLVWREADRFVKVRLITTCTRARMARTLSERVFAQLIQLPLRFHLGLQTGTVTQALTNGSQG